MDPELEELEREFNDYLGKDKFDQPVVEPIMKPKVEQQQIVKPKTVLYNGKEVSEDDPRVKYIKYKLEKKQYINDIDSGKIKLSKEEYPFLHYMQQFRLSQKQPTKTQYKNMYKKQQKCMDLFLKNVGEK